MSDVRVEIHDAELSAFLNADNGPVAADLRARGRRVTRAAKRFVPVDEGDLRESIDSELGHDAEGIFVQIGSLLPYALRIELGFDGVDSLGRTYNQAPQPYLRPALREQDGSRTRLSADEAHVRAAFNDSRRRKAGGRTHAQDRAQLRRNTRGHS